MGVNVFIQTVAGENHPAWDWIRQSGDRAFWDVCKGLEFDQHEAEGFPWLDDRFWVRPRDLAAFRAAPWPDEYARRRYHLAADLLEENPDYWLYFSY